MSIREDDIDQSSVPQRDLDAELTMAIELDEAAEEARNAG